MSQDDATPTIPQGHVPAGLPHDGTTPKYLAGFRAAVRRMMGPQPHQWAATYGDAARIEQMLQRAYQQGLLDGHALVVPLDAPAADANEWVEVPRPTLEEVRADLGLFDVAEVAPPQIGQILSSRPPLPAVTGSPRVWQIRMTMSVLGLSLAEATEFVNEMGTV
ncbi:MAG: hypothetical protein ACOYB3_01885 [Azonexus sp.]